MNTGRPAFELVPPPLPQKPTFSTFPESLRKNTENALAAAYKVPILESQCADKIVILGMHHMKVIL